MPSAFFAPALLALSSAVFRVPAAMHHRFVPAAPPLVGSHPRTAAASSLPRVASPPRAMAVLDKAITAMDNVGETAVFDNVNIRQRLAEVFGLLFSRSAERDRLGRALMSLTKGLDELAAIAIYLLLVDRLLKLVWRAFAWLRSKFDAEAPAGSYGESLVGALQPAAKRFGWGMLLLWLVDAGYILAAAVSPSLAKSKKSTLPTLVGTVMTTLVAGTALL